MDRDCGLHLGKDTKYLAIELREKGSESWPNIQHSGPHDWGGPYLVTRPPKPFEDSNEPR